MTAASADLRSLVDDLHRASSGGMDKSASELLHETAVKVQAFAQARAPRKTGQLASHITIVWVSALTVEITPTMPYAAFVEFGTASRGEFGGQPYEIRPKKPGGVLVFEVDGQRIFARKVVHPGIKAEPYMRPAVMEALEPFTQALLERGALQITKGPRSTL